MSFDVCVHMHFDVWGYNTSNQIWCSVLKNGVQLHRTLRSIVFDIMDIEFSMYGTFSGNSPAVENEILKNCMAVLFAGDPSLDSVGVYCILRIIGSVRI